jgi:homoserine O-acetyltransferase
VLILHGRGQSGGGMLTRFLHYTYDDMVPVQNRQVTEGLGVRHLLGMPGNSLAGMHVWLWGEAHPDFMAALVPRYCYQWRDPGVSGVGADACQG